MHIDFSKWHATPMTVLEAKKFASLTYQKKMQCMRTQQDLRMHDYAVDELIAVFWQEKDYLRAYSNLLKTNTDKCLQAHLSVVLGQLLMSKKLQPAMDYLEQGMHALNSFLSSHEYITLMRRNEVLSAILLSSKSYPAATLEQLENEAKVIIKLKGKRSHCVTPKFDAKDTLG